MFGIIKKLFLGSEKTQMTLTEKSRDLNEDLSIEFKKDYYEKLKKINNADEFHRFAVDLIVEKIRETEYGNHEEFLNEIRYFIHYLLLVIKDDYTHGDKICLKTLTQFDNYIFSAYRKKPDLAENIRRITMLAASKRFTENPKQNILSYFVFLEENGIELIGVLQDYTDILDNKKPHKTGFFSGKNPQDRRNEDDKENYPFQSLASIAPSMKNLNTGLNPRNLKDEKK